MGRSQLTALLALAMLLSPGLLRAQSAEDKATADAAFEEGKRLMNAHAYTEACPKFAESLRRAPGIGTMLGLADCYEKNGQTASAWAEFREAASAAARKGDKREALARENAARLEPRLSKILVRVPSDASAQGLVVKRDGVEVGRALWEEAVPVDPGVHTISASAPGSKDWQTTVDAPATSGVVSVTVPRLELASSPPLPAPSVATAPAATAPEELSNHAGRTRRTVAVVIAGAGVVSAIVGTVSGLVAKSKLDQSNSNDHCDPTDACDETGLSLRSSAESAATVSTVTFVVAGVAVASGAVLWLTAPRTQSAHVGLAPSAGGFSLIGEW